MESQIANDNVLQSVTGNLLETIADLVEQNKELKKVLARALKYVDADFEGKFKTDHPGQLGRVIAEALKESE